MKKFQNPHSPHFVGEIVIQMTCTVAFRDAGNSIAIAKSRNVIGCVNWAQDHPQNGVSEGSNKKEGPARGQLVLPSRFEARGAPVLNTKMA